MVSVLYSRFEPCLGLYIVVFALNLPLCTCVKCSSGHLFFLGTSDKWIPRNLAMDWHLMQRRVEILLVVSCYRNRDKLRHDGPLGSNADFSNFTFCFKVRKVVNSNPSAATRTCRHVALAIFFFQFLVNFVTVNIGSIAYLPYILKLLKLVFSDERDAFFYCTLHRAVKLNDSGHKCSEACCGFGATPAKMQACCLCFG